VCIALLDIWQLLTIDTLVQSRYALKMYVLTGEEAYLDVWNDAYGPIMRHSRGPDGFWVSRNVYQLLELSLIYRLQYRTVDIANGELAVQHIDSLGAFWPGLQVLAGDIENAVKAHLVCRCFVSLHRWCVRTRGLFGDRLESLETIQRNSGDIQHSHKAGD
jgi:hypothetical protein